MNHIFKLNAVLTTLCLVPVASVVHAASSIEGQISNANGKPLAGVLVKVKGTSQTVFSDESGRYILRQVPQSDITLVYEYLGLPAVERQIDANIDGATTLNVRLGAATDNDVEVLEVKGQREAQNKALNLYRASDAVASFIAADDIGQFVDQNVAESLQRLPGLAIARDQGEGRFVSVRGISAGLSNVTINGMRIGTPEDGSRAVPLDVIPTGSVEGISVVKAPTPDMPGDAIGGSVDVQSASPFDRDGRNIRYRAEASYNELSGETSPKVQFNFSDTFDDKFGVSFGINFLDRKLESDNIEAEYDS